MAIKFEDLAFQPKEILKTKMKLITFFAIH